MCVCVCVCVCVCGGGGGYGAVVNVQKVEWKCVFELYADLYKPNGYRHRVPLRLFALSA